MHFKGGSKLKSSSCSIGNFEQMLLSLVFQPQDPHNRNCTGTRGFRPNKISGGSALRI